MNESLKNADIDRETLKNKRVGVCIGTNAAGCDSNRYINENDSECTGERPYITPAQKFLVSNPAVRIAREYDLSGPLQTIVTACSAGGDAIGTAASWIRQDLCDIVITGGADELYEITYNGFISLLNCDDSPCKPFDAERKGMNLGEGAAVLILESEQNLLQRGIKPRAFVMGYGSASDAYHLTTPAPDGRGLRLAIAEALAGAGISGKDIAFINAHGTGTPDNDKIESILFHELFPGIPFLSTKGYKRSAVLSDIPTLKHAAIAAKAFPTKEIKEDTIADNNVHLMITATNAIAVHPPNQCNAIHDPAAANAVLAA